MLQLKLRKNDTPQTESVSIVVDSNVEAESQPSTVIKGKHYVNLPRVITDNAPSILEYIDNEISIYSKKISLLEAERGCVVRLLEVASEAKK